MIPSYIVKSLFILILISSSASATPFVAINIDWKDKQPYESPSQRFLEEHSFEEVYKTLKSADITLKRQSFYSKVTSCEERGHIGYHAAAHKFRVFQDIIRMTLEEILELEFKNDFFFFRIPGDPQLNDHISAAEFLQTYPLINDNEPDQRNQIISTNFTPYSNFNLKFECTAVFFEKAISFKPPKFEDKIAYLFQNLGMPTFTIAELFRIGLQVENPDAGVLFQFFDCSHQEPTRKNAYDFIDRMAYPSIKKGEYLYVDKTFSELYSFIENKSFNHQYRIVVNNYEFLNPYSSIHMRRYDLNDRETIETYEQQLRLAIKKIPHSKSSAKAYKAKLMSYWNSI